MECKQCHVDKETNETNFYKSNSSFGWDKTCKECRAENVKNKPKSKDKNQSKYQKSKHGYINPKYPIPIKKTTEDGFGGKWSFSYDVIQEPLIKSFIQTHSIYHRNGHRKTLQIKSANQQQMIDLANCMSMNPKAVIHIQREKGKEHLETYVINLFHPTILQVLQ